MGSVTVTGPSSTLIEKGQFTSSSPTPTPIALAFGETRGETAGRMETVRVATTELEIFDTVTVIVLVWCHRPPCLEAIGAKAAEVSGNMSRHSFRPLATIQRGL